MLGSYSSRWCTLDIWGMDRVLTLASSFLKARILSLDQILDWDDSVSAIYLGDIFCHTVGCCVVRVLGAFDINFSWRSARWGGGGGINIASNGALRDPKFYVFNVWTRVIDLCEFFEDLWGFISECFCRNLSLLILVKRFLISDFWMSKAFIRE